MSSAYTRPAAPTRRAMRTVMYPLPAPMSATTIPGVMPIRSSARSGSSSDSRSLRSSQSASVAMPAICRPVSGWIGGERAGGETACRRQATPCRVSASTTRNRRRADCHAEILVAGNRDEAQRAGSGHADRRSVRERILGAFHLQCAAVRLAISRARIRA